MSDISRVALFGKLNSLGYKAVEGATVFCKLRGNPYVELVHWFHQILQLQNSDVHAIVRAFNLDASRLARDFTESLDRLPRGATSISDLSSHFEDVIERAWVWATLKYGDGQVRTGHVLLAMLKTSNLKNVLLGMSREFDKIKADQLADDFEKIVANSPESALRASDGSGLGGQTPGEASEALAPAQMGKQEALKKFTVDLTEQARKRQARSDRRPRRGDPPDHRHPDAPPAEQSDPHRRGRRRQDGGGRGFRTANRAAATCRPPLKDVSLRTLDVGLLQAGASMKGEFEQRLRRSSRRSRLRPKPIILFIDEAHTLVGAGGAAGTGDAANLLKPALARGTLRTIARHHLGRVQEAHREGPGADAALPGRAGAGAVGGEGHPDDARRRIDDGEASRRAAARRGASKRPCSCRTATFRRASCPTRR